MKDRGFLGLLRPVVLVTVLIFGLPPALAGAQPVAAPTAAVIQPTMQLEIPPPQLRTWQEMKAAAALEAAGPPPPPRVIPFRPTMDAAAYRQLKATAARNLAPQAPAAPGITALAPLAPTVLSNTVNFEGVQYGNGPGQAGLFIPPDTEGAVGLNHFVEIVNTHLDIYEKAAPNNHVSGVDLNSFFGYTKPTWPNATSMFDPRVIFDAVSRRWIMSADAFAETAATQWFFFAVSQTADPTGAFFIYQVNVSDGFGVANDVEWDFPQVGLDQHAVIFTANFFNKAGAFVDARMFTVAKSLLYNGPGTTLTPTMFTGLAKVPPATLSAPIVLDANPNTYLVAAPSSGSQVTIYTLTNSAGNPPLLSGPAFIPVSPYSVPPNIAQFGTTATLDPSDGRFVNAGTQIGNSLFQVHSIASGGFARCRFYEFDTVNKQVIQSGNFGRSSTSYDFNASIAANRHKDVFVTWSATDPTNNANAEVRFSGRLHTDPTSVIPSPGSLLAGGTSATFYNVAADPQRWGDYSAVTLDPADPSGATAWIVNEKILTNTTWGTRIGSIRLPVKTPLPFVDLLLLLGD
ncbi:MAG: hypothetical protein NTY36_13780 [Deltaproteobacteria bacterium]|nr:hypothetical protein [Deltaproteobacteria bacterium]